MRNLRVKINSIFLSRSGADFIEPCELTVQNYEDLQAVWVGAVGFTANGRAVTTLAPIGAIPFSIAVTKLYADVYQSLKDLAKDNIAAQAAVFDISQTAFPVEIIGYSPSDNLSFEAVFNPQIPYRRARFLDSRNFEIQFNLVKV